MLGCRVQFKLDREDTALQGDRSGLNAEMCRRQQPIVLSFGAQIEPGLT